MLLGSFNPTDVAVEILHGPLDTRGEIIAGEALPLNYQASEGAVGEFQGGIPCREAGLHGFAVRVLPFRRELNHKFETGLLTWWSGDATAPSETVAEKVG